MKLLSFNECKSTQDAKTLLKMSQHIFERKTFLKNFVFLYGKYAVVAISKIFEILLDFCRPFLEERRQNTDTKTTY
jgi:hypothetical protein